MNSGPSYLSSGGSHDQVSLGAGGAARASGLDRRDRRFITRACGGCRNERLHAQARARPGRKDGLRPVDRRPTSGGPDPIQDYIQPDTEIEPSIAVNPTNPKNVVSVFQDRRIADGGDATNGFSTSLDGGKTWTTGTLPGLTNYPGQGGVFERASDAVVAFGPDGTAYANSLVFDWNNDDGLRSGIAVNVSKDGGRHWSPPVYLQDDMIGGLNDKNWIVVDQSDAPGHHKGRVYVVWDRIDPVVYDYCDHDCDRLANWLPDFQTIPGLVFAGQGIGAYPVITKDGGLGIVMDALSGGVPIPSGPDEVEVEPGSEELVYIAAPAAGSTPWPAPLAFLPPVDIAANLSNGTPAQRASDGLLAAAVDPASGTIYAAWDDGRYRTDNANDAVISRSFDNGLHWTMPQRINPGSTIDHVDHYALGVAVGDGGTVHVSYRQRDESSRGPLYTPVIDRKSRTWNTLDFGSRSRKETSGVRRITPRARSGRRRAGCALIVAPVACGSIHTVQPSM